MTAPDEYGMVVVGNVRYRKEDAPAPARPARPAADEPPAGGGEEPPAAPATNGEQPPTDPADVGANGGVLSTDAVKSRQPANKSRAAADK